LPSSAFTERGIDTIDDEAALVSMAQEIKRRRAEQRAGREHVEHVVIEVALQEIMLAGFPNPIATIRSASLHIASRVADRLSAPVLSEDELQELGCFRNALATVGHSTKALGVIDRLIAGKP
jgi:hypothetical protein